MSLHFVSTSVLSSTDGVSHNTETQLDPSSTSTNQTYQKPLYEQLRANAEQDQEKYDEITKSMRGTTTLNEEDVAFIQSVEDRKAEKKSKVKRKEEEEIQLFRAARLEKTMTKSEIVLDDYGADEAIDEEVINAKVAGTRPVVVQDSSKVHSSLINMKPTIFKKRRRRTDLDIQTESSGARREKELDGTKRLRHLDNDNKLCKEKDSSEPIEKFAITEKTNEDAKEEVCALGGLLAYGSDSDSD